MIDPRSFSFQKRDALLSSLSVNEKLDPVFVEEANPMHRFQLETGNRKLASDEIFGFELFNALDCFLLGR
jgi:hypothetical protein